MLVTILITIGVFVFGFFAGQVYELAQYEEFECEYEEEGDEE